LRYHKDMIKSFRDEDAERIFRREFVRRLPHDIQKIAMRKLWMIDAAIGLADLRIPPSNRLESLHGDRKGQYSIRINDQWRVCFRWQGNDAHEVEIIDYH